MLTDNHKVMRTPTGENKSVLDFHSLRGDWYASNQTLPRIVRQVVERRKLVIFVNFPRHWLPLIHLFNLKWQGTVNPPQYVPIYSDLSEAQILSLVDSSKRHGVLRTLVESTTICDPILSDFLYIFDNTISPESEYFQSDLKTICEKLPNASIRRMHLNGWQSYGRPAVRAIEQATDMITSSKSTAAILPCALKRPYAVSRTHKKIYDVLAAAGYDLANLHRIVFTSLGILPEETWSLPQVVAYDCGVPDIYRTLRLARRYFRRVHYELVLDCLQFEPYSDVLRIIRREELIGDIVTIKVPKKRHFHIPHK